jgi:hypothetical protein
MNKFEKLKPMIEQIVYGGNTFKVLMNEYDKSDKGQTLLGIIVGTLVDLQHQLKMTKIDLDLMFYASVITALDVNDAIRKTGREVPDDQTLSKAISGAGLHFLVVNKGKFDPKELKQKSAELKQMADSGQIEKMMQKQRGLLAA